MLSKKLYQACDSVRSAEQLWSELAKESANMTAYSLQAVEENLGALVERMLMLRDGLSYLSLAIPLGDYAPNSIIRQRLQRIGQKLSKTQDGKMVIPLEEFVIQV